MICPGWQKPHCATSSSSHALLYRVQVAVGSEAFDRGDPLSHDVSRSKHAHLNRTAVHVAGAGAAHAYTASGTSARHAEQVAQDPEEGHVSRRVDVYVLAVELNV